MKTTNTRKQRAEELLNRCTRGFSPSIFDFPDRGTRIAIEHSYRIWSQSWVIPELIDLVPELKHHKKAKEGSNQNDDPKSTSQAA